MKKQTYVGLIFLCICAAFFCMIITFSRAAPPDETIPKVNNSNYFILRYVVGSGGLSVANAQNFHTATAGEMAVGFSHNDKNIALSGFWAPMVAAGPSDIGPENDSSLPTSFILYQNYPNPFNPQTTIEYDLPLKSQVTIEIFNSVGQRIRLLHADTQIPGHYRLFWDARDDYSRLMGSGLYFYRLTAKSMKSDDGTNNEPVFQDIKKMLFIK